jgi:two-component system chemotaxis family response regulator WspR
MDDPITSFPFETTARQPPRTRVLLIDDQRIVAEAVHGMLANEPDIDFRHADNPRMAMAAALQWKPTVILLDLIMPQKNGFEQVKTFRAHPATRDVPIIMMSSKEDPLTKAQGFTLGANDYLIKLPDALELVARVRYHSAAYNSRLERDEAFRELRNSQQELAEANIKLQRLAEIDGLTGIANRRRLDEALDTEWQRGLRSKLPLSLIMFDIDCFKLYNDSHGHPAGDTCLRKVAHALAGCAQRPADLAARYGGEEFVLILPETDTHGALAVASTCRSRIEALGIPHQASTVASVVTLSIGVGTVIPTSNSTPATLVNQADSALYDAKKRGRNQVVTLA